LPTFQKAAERLFSADASGPMKDEKWLERLVMLFRRLARSVALTMLLVVRIRPMLDRLSNHAIQDMALEKQEEKRCETYTGLSAELAKISPSAATAVTQTLSNIVVNHAEAKERVERDFRALEHLWQDVFDVLMAEIIKVIGAGVDNALEALKLAGQDVVDAVYAAAPQPLKRKARDGAPYGKDSEHAGGTEPALTPEEGECHESKRRRLAGTSPRWPVAAADEFRPLAPAESGVNTFLRELKDQFEMQARSLDTLAQENSHVGVGPACFHALGRRMNSFCS
jgi:hypothetical protein